VKSQKYLILFSLIGMSYWLFGNLYEEIVISPNWIEGSVEQMTRLHQFFKITSPTHYFVPLTQIATITIWIAFFTNKIRELKKDLQMASIFGVLATLINFHIVITIVLKLFSHDYLDYSEQLHELCWRWNLLNVLRMILTGITLYFLFTSYLKLDRLVSKG
jgi:hypothetical protein